MQQSQYGYGNHDMLPVHEGQCPAVEHQISDAIGLAPQITKTPPTTYFIKQAAGIESGSQRPGHQSVATISAKHVYEIAKVKQQDMRDVPLESVCRTIVGTARSMGVKVIGRTEDSL